MNFAQSETRLIHFLLPAMLALLLPVLAAEQAAAA